MLKNFIAKRRNLSAGSVENIIFVVLHLVVLVVIIVVSLCFFVKIVNKRIILIREVSKFLFWEERKKKIKKK